MNNKHQTVKADRANRREKTTPETASGHFPPSGEPAQSNAADLTPLAADLGCAVGDLVNIPASIASRALRFLIEYRDCGRYRPAMEKANVRGWELQIARRRSNTFANIQDGLKEARAFAIATEIEETLADLASGNYVNERGEHLPPDVRAASLYLAAHDPKYKPGASVPISNIQINVQF